MSGVVHLHHLKIPGHEPTSRGNVDHPMRVVTRRAAGLGARGWDDECRSMVNDVFDELAGEWNQRDTPERRAVVVDAFERGLGSMSRAVAPDRSPTLGVEIGSGTGIYSGMVAQAMDRAVSMDLSMEMLREARDGPSARVRADASLLPLRDDTVDLIVIINMFLFPAEVARVLKGAGLIVWVNSSGADTPIHLTTSEVVEALPFPVRGVESSAGVGTWCVLQRQS